MIYAFLLFMAACGYHSLTYGIHLWKKERNRLGGLSMILLSVLGTVIPAYIMLLKA